LTAATAATWAAARTTALRLATRVSSRFSSRPLALPATALFTTAVWVLRTLAIVATLFVALRIASWLA
jgi:hypothetical protein